MEVLFSYPLTDLTAMTTDSISFVQYFIVLPVIVLCTLTIEGLPFDNYKMY